MSSLPQRHIRSMVRHGLKLTPHIVIQPDWDADTLREVMAEFMSFTAAPNGVEPGDNRSEWFPDTPQVRVDASRATFNLPDVIEGSQPAPDGGFYQLMWRAELSNDRSLYWVEVSES